MEAARTEIGRVDALMYLDRYADALRVGRRALSEFHRLNEPARAGRLLTNLGNLEYRRDRPAAALAFYEEALALLRGRAEDRDLAAVEFNVGNILSLMDRDREAEQRYLTARTAARTAGDAVLEVMADYAVAGLALVRGHYPDALVALADCEDRFSALGHERGRLNCLLDRAETYRRLGLHADAAHAAEEALSGVRRLRLAAEEARALFLAGIGRVRGGDPEPGRRLLLRAERRFLALGNPVQAAAVVLRAAQSEQFPASNPSAARSLDRAASRFRAAGHRELAAEADLERARRAIARKERRGALRLLDAVDATPAGTRAELRAESLRLRALLHEVTDPARAAALAEKALDAAAILRDRLGDGELVGAHLGDRRRFHRDALRLAAAGPLVSPERAFAALARADHALAPSRAAASGPARAKRAADLEPLRRRVAVLRARLNPQLPEPDSGARRRRAARALVRAEREYAEAARRERLAGPKAAVPVETAGELHALQAALRPGELWIHPFETGPRIAAMRITRDRAEVEREGVDAASFRQHVEELEYQMERVRMDEEYLDRFADGLRRSADRALHALGAFLRPLFPRSLDGVSSVLLRPGAGMDAVPWGALPLDGDLLWARGPVQLVPDAATFLRARRRKPRSGVRHDSLPMFWGVRDSTVPEAETEVRELAARFERAEIHVGSEGVRRAFLRRAPHASLLHFAGHGVFRRDNPLFSSLRLHDGDLYFLDLEPLQLRASLVVLSACRTAVGDGEFGLGTGFTRGFLRAGAETLVAALWPVADRSARRLTTAFYDALAETAPPDALRRAALRRRAEGAHPADWAPFQAAGTGSGSARV